MKRRPIFYVLVIISLLYLFICGFISFASNSSTFADAFGGRWGLFLIVGILPVAVIIFGITYLQGESAKSKKSRADRLEWERQMSEWQGESAKSKEYIEAGSKYAASENWQQAIDSFEKAIRLNPNDAKAHLGLFMSYGAIKDLEKAQLHYGMLAKLDPKLANEAANSIGGQLILKTGGIINISQDQVAAEKNVPNIAKSDETAQDKSQKTYERFIEIKNNYGWGMGDKPFSVQQEPDLQQIFTDPNPAIPMKPSNVDDDYRRIWERASVDGKRVALAIAYLQHPNAEVRKSTLTYVRNISDMYIVNQVLADMFSDKDPQTRVAVAKLIWDKARERQSTLENMISILKDEIRRPGRILGGANAKQALNLLVEYAPDDASKDTAAKLIGEHS